jgi:Flp pilus assembly protein TadD
MAGFPWGCLRQMFRFELIVGCFALLLLPGQIAGQQATAEDNYNLGIGYFREGRLAEARPLLERATALSPKAADAWMALSLVVLGLNDFAGAVDPLRHACELVSGEEDACYLLGRTLFLVGDYNEAVKPLEKAMRSAPSENQPKIHRAAALNFDKLGDAADAELHFRKAIQLYRPREGSHEDPRLDYGAFLVRQGRATEAIEPMEEALKASPLSAQANAELGRALLDLDRPQDALPRLKKAVEIDPGGWAARMLLGKAYLRVGRPEDGERELRTAREAWAKEDHGSSKVQ